MATMFIQQSEEYVRQIEAEIERLQQLRDQVQTIMQNEEALGEAEAEVKPARRPAKKSPGKKAAATKEPAKRGRPRLNPEPTE